jgi:protein O-GlcNAc transferase
MKQRGGGFGRPQSANSSWKALSGGNVNRAPVDPAAALMQKGLDLQRRGQLREANLCFHQVIAANPHHPEANHALGLIAHQTGNSEIAAKLIARAIETSPTQASYRSNLGVVLVALGRHTEAVESYRQALKRDPSLAAVQSNLGIALLALGRAEEAAQAHRRALVLQPNYAEAHANLGLALTALGREEEAIKSLRKAIAVRPDHVNAYVYLGDALARQGAPEDAVASYRAALRLNPEHAGAHNNLANVFRQLKRFLEAADNYRAAIYIKPTATAYANLGQTLEELGESEAAIANYQAALDLAPQDAAIAGAYGRLLTALGRTEEAAAVEARTADRADKGHELSELEERAARDRMAISVDPSNAVAHNNLASTLATMGKLKEAREVYREALRLRPDYFLAWSDMLFTSNYLGDLAPAEGLVEAKAYGDALARRVTARQSHRNGVDPDRRLRIGLVSGDLRSHPVGRFLDNVLGELDPTTLELFAYSAADSSDELTERLMRSVPNWRDVQGVDNDALDAIIVADKIDILMDLSGHTARNQLQVFARKPAPIAVTWLGYFATTGLTAIDYVLANRFVIPLGEEDQWVEKPWRLPETYLCFAPPKIAAPLAPPPERKNGYVTFGSANNLSKTSDPTVACWADVLKAVPGSRLVLRSTPLADTRVADSTRQRFAEHGVEPERLVLQKSVSDYGQHLAAYNQIDIALDPFPYAGGTTSVEALWMGVPVLTLKGDRYVAHMGENILHHMDMPDWIAETPADYVAKAARHAADLDGLTALRSGLRHRLAVSPLCDAPRFARNLEVAFRGMWQVWCAEQASKG